MKRLLAHVGACSLTAALCLAHVQRPSAQTTLALPGNKPGDAAPNAFSLFRFVAKEDSESTAKDTLAGTRLRTEVKVVGSIISVTTQKFLQNTPSEIPVDLLASTTGTEVADRTNFRSSPSVGAAAGRIHGGNIVTFSAAGSSTRSIAFAASAYRHSTGGGDAGAAILLSFNHPNSDNTL